MRIKFFLGFSLTSAWLIFSAAFFFSKSSIAEISVNELGDFLAGFISPVAIIWLVYGHIQQSYELSSQKEEYIKSIKLSAYIAMMEYEMREREMYHNKSEDDPNGNWRKAAKNSKNRAEIYKSKVKLLLEDIENRK